MANLMHNVIVLTGPRVAMRKFYDAYVKPGFKFSAIVPMTEEDKNCLNGAGYAAWGCPADPEAVIVGKGTDKDTREAVLNIQFLTKWSAPSIFYQKLAAMYPELDINATGIDIGTDLWYEGRTEPTGKGGWEWQERTTPAHFKLFTRRAKKEAWMRTGLIKEPESMNWKNLLADTSVWYELMNALDMTVLDSKPMLKVKSVTAEELKDIVLKHSVPF